MSLILADTFTDSLAKLTADEVRAVKITLADLMLAPDNPGMQQHKLDRVKDNNFWSARVNRDIRLIVHKINESILACYVDHHDKAYDWATRRKFETHPSTGVPQFVEIRETVKEIVIPTYIEAKSQQSTVVLKSLFADIADEQLLAYGVPVDWLADVKQVNENTLFDLSEHLPPEAAEALLDLATGNTPVIIPPVAANIDPFEHPDALRSFRVMNNKDELERALDFPWEKWTIFLHPAQRDLVERDFGGPTRVAGSAGTGKTVVALHRAVHLAKSNPDTRILLTTFSDSLASALEGKLKALVDNQPRLKDQIEVYSLDTIAKRFYKLSGQPLQLATHKTIKTALAKVVEQAADNSFSEQFLLAEWTQVVDAWQLYTWEAYKDVPRLGRRTRLPETKRVKLWSIFENLQTELKSQGLLTMAALYKYLEEHYLAHESPFDFVVLDEAQDVSVSQLRFLAALAAKKENGLFFSGDLGQRIFQPPFSWQSLGVSVRGRSHTLKINYRTSHQIRSQADLLLTSKLRDVDGIEEDRSGTISVFNGPKPEIKSFESVDAEISGIANWLKTKLDAGLKVHEIGIFVRSDAELQRAEAAAKKAGIPANILTENYNMPEGKAAVSTMHFAKGLEFRAVVVMACDDEVMPLQARIETVTDNADLEEVYDTERHLLYVACTRARDHLFVSGVEPVSEFVDDLQG